METTEVSSVPFSAIITPQSVSYTSVDGKVHNVDSSHKNWKEIIETVKEIQHEVKISGSADAARANLAELVDVSATINNAGAGRVIVRDGIVYYEDEPVHLAVTERIIWGLQEGFDMTSYMLFLDNSMENPSKRAVDEMYSFMEKHNMGITDDGHILGYKKVREDFKDIYTGTMDNSPGQIVEMKRNHVDDDARHVCSKGLHFCAMSYLPSYGSSSGSKIVIVKVNPRDIVSVPIDYGHAKVRACRYEVLSEYTGSDVEDLLGTKAIWSDSDFDSSYDEDDDSEDGWGFGEDDILGDSFDDEDDLPDLPEDDLSEENAKEEIPSAHLSDEGADMRHIMDSVDAPKSEDGIVMRSLIDVIEEAQDIQGSPGEVIPVVFEPENTISPETEAAVRTAFDNLVRTLSEIEATTYKKD